MVLVHQDMDHINLKKTYTEYPEVENLLLKQDWNSLGEKDIEQIKLEVRHFGSDYIKLIELRPLVNDYFGSEGRMELVSFTEKYESFIAKRIQMVLDRNKYGK